MNLIIVCVILVILAFLVSLFRKAIALHYYRNLIKVNPSKGYMSWGFALESQGKIR
jgi:hypothetical protein